MPKEQRPGKRLPPARARRGLRARQLLQGRPCPAPGPRGEHELQPSQLRPNPPGRCLRWVGGQDPALVVAARCSPHTGVLPAPPQDPS